MLEYPLPDGSYCIPDGKRVSKETPGLVKSSKSSQAS